MNFIKRPNGEPLKNQTPRWTALPLTSTLIATITCAMAIVIHAPTLGAAQDNPFATDVADQNPGFNVSGPSATAPRSDAGSNDARFQLNDENARSGIGLVVRSIRTSDPQSADQLLNAVQTLMDVQAVGDARFYLNQLIAKNLNAQQQFELYQLRGPEFFYQLHATDELAPEGRMFAKDILAAAKKFARSPERISQLIKRLSNSDINVRSTALQQLKRIGPTAYAAMLEVFADPNRQTEFSGIRGAVQRLREDATDVLIAAARSKHPRIATESYVAIMHLRTKAALKVIGYLYLSPKTPASVKQLAAQTLKRTYGTINESQLYQQIQRGAKSSLKIMETGFNSQTTVLDWTFDPQTKRFRQDRVTTILAAKRSAAFDAELLYQIDPHSEFNRELFLLTQIDAAKQAVGPDDLIDAKALAKKFDDPTAFEWNVLLKRALRLKMVPAAIGICELIAHLADPASLLTGSRSQLIEAILYGDRHLQFAAFEAVIAIDPKSAYPGSSHVVELAAFLAKTQGVEKALVGHLLGPSAQSYSSIVGATGLSVQSARNGRSFYNAAIENPDFEVFVVTQSLVKPSPRELIQLLRSDWRTRQVPIAFVGDDIGKMNSVEILAQSDPLLRRLQMTFDSRVVASGLSEIQSRSSSWPVSAASRLLHGQVAVDWMLKMIEHQPSHRFYQIQRHQEVIFALLANESHTAKACEMIAKLGTAKSQQALANFASQSGFSIAQRQSAAECFSASVKKFGTLLTTDQIQQQYDRYNATESQSAEVQKLMGGMVDAIESQSVANR